MLNQVVELLSEVVKEDRVVVDVLQEELACSLTVALKLDTTVFVVQIKHRVKRVVVQVRFFTNDGF